MGPEYIGNVVIRSSNDTGYGISCLGGAFAIAVAINYFAPVMDWVASWTKRIKNKTLEYVVRGLSVSFIEILFNSVWCMYNSGNIVYWPAKFPILLAVGTIAIFISLPIMVRVATACAKK